jgi:hypothetical protein
MNPLALLSKLLSEAAGASPVVLRENTEIDGELARLEAQSKSGGRSYEPRDLQAEAVKRFWVNPIFESLRDARLVSFGLGLDVAGATGSRKCIMEDPRLFNATLTGVDGWGQIPRQFRKCYQGLLRSYFDYDGLGRSAPEVGKQNWSQLQQYLRSRAPYIVDTNTNPDWVTCTGENPGILTSVPCSAFAEAIARGRHEHVKRVRELLGITDASWFTRELVLAQIEHACRLPHPEFSNAVTGLLSMLDDNEVLRDRGLSLLLNRYAKVPQTPQHLQLKEVTVTAWGNPWLPSNKDCWGSVEDSAKEMVSDWLKLEFIDLFFTKLAQDRIGDTRRVKFWRRYVKSIDNIHFALGSTAMSSNEKDFKEIRVKLKGLLVRLDDTDGANNAFIMTMGDLVAVEFSNARNAFYGYSLKRTLPFVLTKPVLRTPVDGPNSLKSSAHLLKINHTNGVFGYDTWEERFAAELKHHFGLLPNKPSATRVVAPPASLPPAPAAPPAPPVKPPPSPGLGSAWPWTPSSTPSAPAAQTVVSPPEVPTASTSQSPSARSFQLPPGTRTGSTGQQTTSEGHDSILRRGQSSPSTSAAPLRAKLPTPESEVFNKTNLNALVRRMNVSVDDRTSKGGALWILATDNNPDARRILLSWGFAYKAGKGWWRTPEE